MHEFVQVVAIIVGGVTVICVTGIAWLAGATFKSMKMKERKQAQELNTQLLEMSEGGKDVKAELIRIRADLSDINNLIQKQSRPSELEPASAEPPPPETARELRQQ